MELQVKQELNAQTGASSSPKPYTRRSDVWKFMRLDPNSKTVICQLCGFHLTCSSRSGTSNLRNHLISRHHDQYTPKIIPIRAKRKYSATADVLPVGDRIENVDRDGEISRSGANGAAAGSSGAEADRHGAPGIGDSVPMAKLKDSSDSSKANQATKKKKFCPATRAQSITNLIFRMIVEDLLPIGVVEGTGFRGLIDGLEYGYTFPTKFNLEERLNVRLKEGREKLLPRLSENDQKQGLCIDLWTDHYGRNFITLTSHLINVAWKSENWTVGTIEVNTNATDEDVAGQIRNLCEEGGLFPSSVVGVVYGTDSSHAPGETSERLKVLRSICAYLSWECRPCAGELLGIAVQNALSVEPIADVIQAAGKLIMYLALHKEMYKKLCDILQERQQTTLLTLCDLSSKWQMICDMFVQLSELQEPIAAVLGDDKEQNLSKDHWKLLPEIIRALQSVKAAIAVLGDARNKSGACWLPVMQGVLQHIEGTSSSQVMSDNGKIFRSVLKSELNANCELNEILPSSLTMLASAVDPRFHHLRFLAEEDRVPVVDELKRRLAELAEAEEPPSTNAKNDQEDTPFFALLGEDEFNKKGIKPEDEIDLFRLERPVSRETDPLNWWRLNEHRFPRLSKLARTILCLPVAATPLSQTDQVKASMENRKRLDPKHVDAQVFLHHNLGLFL